MPVSFNKCVPSISLLCAYRAQSRPFKPRMIRHGQRSLCPVNIIAHHCYMLSFSHDSKAEQLKRLYYFTLRCVNREFSHQAATSASATKTSSTGESLSKTSLPKVSR